LLFRINYQWQNTPKNMVVHGEHHIRGSLRDQCDPNYRMRSTRNRVCDFHHTASFILPWYSSPIGKFMYICAFHFLACCLSHGRYWSNTNVRCIIDIEIKISTIIQNRNLPIDQMLYWATELTKIRENAFISILKEWCSIKM
jgi:hypothetical protein